METRLEVADRENQHLGVQNKELLEEHEINNIDKGGLGDATVKSDLPSDTDIKNLAEMQSIVQKCIKEMNDFREDKQRTIDSMKDQYETQIQEKQSIISELSRQVKDANLQIEELSLKVSAHKV